MPGEPRTGRGRASRERIVERAAELFADALERMRDRGELRADASPADMATALLASIEGGMVLSQARKDPASLHIAVEAGLAQVRTQLN